MNYPIWDVPASGLLIAVVAVVHVFVSHFAVGGGLFLVLTEKLARRRQDHALLAYLKRHSRFFILLTLVFGAMTGVGIWFTIGLVHPSATSSLINTWVWGWAIEWTFFVVEIAAAMVYYYGWDRLDPKTHVAVGWIYFISAWASLAVINGILSYMMTPGEWVTDRGFRSGFFNPTYFSSLAMRTFVAAGLAGIYALLTAAWSGDRELKRKIIRLAGMRWVIPAAVAVPVCLIWYLASAAGAGIPVGPILGVEGEGAGAIISAIFTPGGETGYPPAQTGAFLAIVASGLVIVLTVVLMTARSDRYGRPACIVLLVLGLVAMGGGEWVREDLRKPYVIGGYMFVHGARLPAPAGVPLPERDRFALDSLQRSGILAVSPWADVPDRFPGALETLSEQERLLQVEAAGKELFRLSCSPCHTIDGYLAIRPLVKGQRPRALERILAELARPVDDGGAPASWDDPALRIATWRNRRMPPFPGNEIERSALAAWLASLGGAAAEPSAEEAQAPPGPGLQLFEDNCLICHDPEGEWPMKEMVLGRDAVKLYEMIGRLDEINDMMPPFEGTDEERRALAEYLDRLDGSYDPEGGAP